MYSLLKQSFVCINLFAFITDTMKYLVCGFFLPKEITLNFPIKQALLRMQPAAAAKSLQSCLTLCDTIDSSPPGSPVPGILQTRTLEWVAIVSSRMQPKLSFFFFFVELVKLKHKHMLKTKGKKDGQR